MITKEERDRDKAICDAATPGPWEYTKTVWAERSGTEDVCDLGNDAWVVTRAPALSRYDNDGAFIAAARNRLPVYIAALDEMDLRLALLVADCNVHEARARNLQRSGEHAAAVVAQAKADGMREAIRVMQGEP